MGRGFGACPQQPAAVSVEVCQVDGWGRLAMQVGRCLVLVTLGAILRFGITKHIDGVNLHVIGVILMLVGLAWLGLSVAFATSRRRTDVIYRPDGATYVEPNPPLDPRL